MKRIKDLLPSRSRQSILLELLLLILLINPLELLWRPVPELRLGISSCDQARDVEWIEQRGDEGSCLFVARATNLCLTIHREEHFVRARQVLAWVPDVEHGCVDEHDGGFEDPEVCFAVVERARSILEELHDSVNAPCCDDGARDVQNYQDRANILGADTSLPGPSVEYSSKEHEQSEHDDLKYQP